MEKKSASIWNPWHGCHKLSEGCRHCYVYRGDSKRGRDSSIVEKTGKFDLPLQRKKRTDEYKIPSGNLVYTCFMLYVVLALAVLIGGPFALGFWLGGVRARAGAKRKE